MVNPIKLSALRGFIMKRLFGVVFFVMILAMAAGQVDAQDRVITKEQLGCEDHEYLSKLVGFANSGDMDAFRKSMLFGIMTDVCTMFEIGQPVYLTGTRLRSGLVKVRKPGEIREYYIILEAVGKE